MSKLILYNGLKTDLLNITYTKADSTIGSVKTVALWRNQIVREKEEQPFLRPAIFIEFLPSDYKELTYGVQQYDMIVRHHIVFESYEDEDTDILTLVEAVFAAIHKKQYNYFGNLLRVHEEQNFDHDNVQVYIQDYKTLGKDYAADERPTLQTSPSLTINPTL